MIKIIQTWWRPDEKMPVAGADVEVVKRGTMLKQNAFATDYGTGNWIWKLDSGDVTTDLIELWAYPIPAPIFSEEKKQQLLENAKKMEKLIEETRNIDYKKLQEPFTI